MKPEQILSHTGHRPFELPRGQWFFYQEWLDVIFLHWPVDKDNLQSFIPRELEIEIFGDTTWISLVVFRLKHLRPAYLPGFPPVSDFNEINIRAYVKYNGKPGIYFLSIEGSKRVSCILARSVTEMPYRYSMVRSEENYYDSYNREFKDRLEIKFQKGRIKKNKSLLDRWLTERYALFQDTGKNKIIEFNIHHYEWPLYEAKISKLTAGYERFKSLTGNRPDMVHYSPGIQVLTWGKITHRPTSG
jgi:uncharacterized protein